ncbi:MAG: YggT family protein [Alphaproteobacteria bacterium]|nr:YggT family protein [Alphaproteobacteria bacterium]
MTAVANLIDSIITLYICLVIASAVLTWLVTFNVINPRNRIVYAIGDFLDRVSEPALAPIRRILPSIAGIDLSPVVLIIALFFVRDLLHYMLL